MERNCIRRQVVLDRRCLLPQVQAGRCQLPCPGYIPADTAIPDDRVHSQQLSRWSLARRIIVRHALWRQERGALRSEEHTSELQSLMRISYAVICLKKKKKHSIDK